ncbi:nitroreductase family protein [Cohnella fermenti]|uniref:Nitroreductase family protein n=1 Tax=Cohnella fermenti TaxID=2565925 RepID=A0A4S4C823_9BACL|nr:nitroreductase family protein [Cohnella fermenti]THF84152.1 nitroreductase family protein [Cohnella fermenti]
MSTVQEQDVAESYSSVVRARRSVRNYDPSVKIPDRELLEILEEASLAPSSSNTQTWRFLVISDEKAKERLHPIANNQKQVLAASATIVVLGDLEGYKEIGRINEESVRKGYMPADFAKSFTENSLRLYSGLPAEKMKSIVQIDGALVSMQIMLSAKARGYDTVPMGGYDQQKLIEEFRIPANLVPVMLISVGQAAADAPGRLTARLPIEDIVSWNELK